MRTQIILFVPGTNKVGSALDFLLNRSYPHDNHVQDTTWHLLLSIWFCNDTISKTNA